MCVYSEEEVLNNDKYIKNNMLWSQGVMTQISYLHIVEESYIFPEKAKPGWDLRNQLQFKSCDFSQIEWISQTH